MEDFLEAAACEGALTHVKEPLIQWMILSAEVSKCESRAWAWAWVSVLVTGPWGVYAQLAWGTWRFQGSFKGSQSKSLPQHHHHHRQE